MAIKDKVKSSSKKKKNKNKPIKQGHKLVWFTLIIIMIPVVIVAYVLLTSLGGQNQPVVGNRFDSNDLNPAITEDQISQVQTAVSSIEGVENVEVNLKSATLRVSVDISDSADDAGCASIAQEAYNQVVAILPAETYFTNTEEGKMYDVEIDTYNFLLDDSHTDGQIYYKVYKTGASGVVTQNMTQAKDQELVNQIVIQ